MGSNIARHYACITDVFLSKLCSKIITTDKCTVHSSVCVVFLTAFVDEWQIGLPQRFPDGILLLLLRFTATVTRLFPFFHHLPFARSRGHDRSLKQMNDDKRSTALICLHERLLMPRLISASAAASRSSTSTLRCLSALPVRPTETNTICCVVLTYSVEYNCIKYYGKYNNKTLNSIQVYVIINFPLQRTC